MIIIRAKKRFANFKLDVSMRFGREFVVLTGPNGSGKTTLLRVVAGLTTPDDGKITISEKIFFDGKINLKPEARHIGYVSQDAALFPWLTVEENVVFGIKDGKADPEWLKSLYKELQIDGLLARSPENLSGGEAGRVAIARALAPMPDMLLLDEPFANVDVELRPSLRAFIQKLQRERKIPVLLITHDQAEVHTLGDRVFKLVDGKVVEEKRRGRFVTMPKVSY